MPLYNYLIRVNTILYQYGAGSPKPNISLSCAKLECALNISHEHF